MRRSKKSNLTTPDLVLLSLLAERAMHGYEANLELERRCIRDWAAISRPQVYYSLEKLAAAGFIRKMQSSEPAAGPERTVFETTHAGRAATADALERRRKFVEHELVREKETLRAILKEVGHAHHEAVWMVTLIIQQFRTELKWLRKLQRELPHRAPARHPAYAQASPKK